MKHFPVFFVVVLAGFVSGIVNESEVGEYDSFRSEFNQPVIENKLECISSETGKIVSKYPNLETWFEDVMEFVENLKKSAKKCQSLPGILKKACFMKLKLSAARQADRLKALLPDDQKKEVVNQMKSIIKGCMK